MTNTIADPVVNPGVRRPAYDRAGLKTRIVHIGFGAFHRAHQAVFTDEMLAKTGGDWGICEMSLFSGDAVISSLRRQDHLFTVTEKGADTTEVKMIGAVTEAMHPLLDGIDGLLEKMAEEQVEIFSLTVTEKGYCANPANGRLDKSHTLIQHDLLNPAQPKSAIGYIVEALRRRFERGLAPVTVLSCDNIQQNGHVARAVVLEYAGLLDERLAAWIEQNVTFPCTMVDRIVPAVTEETQNEITELVGVPDPCGVACEPFCQWIIEDNFANGRPEWDLAGAQFVANVVPYEEMKLRMLNGSHSFLAYLGYLGGYAHISDTMLSDDYRRAAFNLMMKEQAPTLDMPKGTDVEGYARQLIERFSNPSLQHRTWQIAMDGSQKLPQRMVDAIKHHIAQGTDYSHLALGVAGWMRYVSGQDESGREIDVRDPMVSAFKDIYERVGVLHPDVVRELLSLDAIFGTSLPANKEFENAVREAYLQLLECGARSAWHL